MSRKKLKTIGVLGGMGPEAGAAFFERIVRETDAGCDQDHPPVVLYSLPQIPDRTEAILRGGRDPVPALRRGLAVLYRAGADFAVMSCISAHYFLPRLVPRSPLSILSLIDETVAAINKMKPVPGTIGLMATDGTVRSGIFARAFEAAGIVVLTPSSRDQARLTTAIYGKKGIKAGFTQGPAQRGCLRGRPGARPSGGGGRGGRLHRDPPGPRARRPPRAPGRSHDRRGPGGGPEVGRPA